MNKSEKHCIDCNKIGVDERRRCKECAKEYNRQRANKRYKDNGRHNFGKSTCPICNKEMTLWRRNQAHHATCKPKTVDDYNKVKRSPSGKTIARQLFIDSGMYIPKNYVVHHLDENPNNNIPSNLIGITVGIHNGLHKVLQHQRSLFLKRNSSYDENCWNILRDHLTTAYLETKGAKVIKIDDIGQSAAEPLSSYEYEEGSETMYVGPK